MLGMWEDWLGLIRRKQGYTSYNFGNYGEIISPMNWLFIKLDSCMHKSIEIPQPSRQICYRVMLHSLKQKETKNFELARRNGQLMYIVF
jgi:hypothetical protein